ncbi:MAG TPA: PIN domain-containing protein [Ktedonobacteraceae bacterium]|nr:PIN domain-containing protein [Ktedonobacteraceae bacterium]
MGLTDILRGKVVGVDTTLFIYFIERNPTYVDIARAFFQLVDRGECKAITSVISLLEVLVVPFRNGDMDLVRQYNDILFDTEGLSTEWLTPVIAEEAARLRASYTLRTPDSIQMATAIVQGATIFITNDKQLPSLPNLKKLMVDDLKGSQ